jgi:hypothetical protein
MREDALVLVYAPALVTGLLEGGGLPRLDRMRRQGRFAGLVPSFPCLPSVVEASSLRGVPPGLHGRLLPRDPCREDAPGIEELLAARDAAAVTTLDRLDPGAVVGALETERRLVLVRENAVLHAGRGAGRTSADRRDAAWALDAALGALVDAIDVPLLLVAGPGLRGAGAVLEVDGLEVEGMLGRMRVEEADEKEAIRKRWLARPGVERVLAGEGLAAWVGAPLADTVLVLAREGWSFQDEAATVGHPEAEEGERGFLLYRGPIRGGTWPAEIHDHRIAPTLARRFGLDAGHHTDRLFPLVS